MHITDEDLLSLVQSQADDAESFNTEIQDERETSLKYYQGEPFGNEIEGRSQVVTRDVLETVEWILPQVLEIFSASDNVVEFTPNNEEDIPQAEQETDYTRYVFDQQNTGFLILYQWIKDALLQKNGIVKVFWDEDSEEEQETYENLSDPEFIELLDDDDVEIEEHTKRINDKEVDTRREVAQSGNPADLIEAQIAQLFDPQSVQHDAVVIRREDISQVSILNIAPENFLVTRNWNSLDLTKVPFCQQSEIKTRGELIDDGFPEDLVMQISGDDEIDESGEKAARFEDTGGTNIDTPSIDPKDVNVVVTESYVRIHEDGKQILMKVTAGGSDSNILLDSERADGIPFIAFTPIIMSHKFYGMSIADIVRDIQLIRSTLMRQTLDSLYLANNPRYVVNGEVNLDDVLTSRPGAPIRTTGDVNTSIANFSSQFVGQASFPMFQLLDQMLTKRTGVSEGTQGLSPESLKDLGVDNIERIMTLSQQRILLIARVFAEVGFAPMMKRIHQLVSKYEKNDKIAELRGKYVNVSPREWRKRRKMRVLVGTGNSGKDIKLAAVTRVLELQQTGVALQGGAEGPLVNLNNIHAALSDFTRLSGLKNTNKYWTNPADAQQQPQEPPQPDPNVIIAEANAAEVEGRNEREVARLIIEREKQALDKSIAEEDSINKNKDREAKTVIELEKIAQDDRDKAADVTIKREEIQAKTEIEVFKAEIAVATKQIPAPQRPPQQPQSFNVNIDTSDLASELSTSTALASNIALEQNRAIQQTVEGVKDAVDNMAEATKELSQATKEVARPKKGKKINIKRDKEGNIIGAESE